MAAVAPEPRHSTEANPAQRSPGAPGSAPFDEGEHVSAPLKTIAFRLCQAGGPFRFRATATTRPPPAERSTAPLRRPVAASANARSLRASGGSTTGKAVVSTARQTELALHLYAAKGITASGGRTASSEASATAGGAAN